MGRSTRSYLSIPKVQCPGTALFAFWSRFCFASLLPDCKNVVHSADWNPGKIRDRLRIEKAGVFHTNDNATNTFRERDTARHDGHEVDCESQQLSVVMVVDEGACGTCLSFALCDKQPATPTGKPSRKV